MKTLMRTKMRSPMRPCLFFCSRPYLSFCSQPCFVFTCFSFCFLFWFCLFPTCFSFHFLLWPYLFSTYLFFRFPLWSCLAFVFLFFCFPLWPCYFFSHSGSLSPINLTFTRHAFSFVLSCIRLVYQLSALRARKCSFLVKENNFSLLRENEDDLVCPIRVPKKRL